MRITLNRRPRTREQQLATMPLRVSSAKWEPHDDGARIKLPLRGNWLFRPPKDAARTFEIDAMGLFVWDRCDGNTSIERIFQALAGQYNLSPRDAEISTLKFLQMLARRGLIGVKTKQ